MHDVARLLCLLLFACLSPLALGERLRLVTDDWAPYVYQHDGQPKGIDYEVTTEVFKRLGFDVEWQFLPWKRCLAMVEQGLADGVMDIFETESRKPYMVYPDEPMSDVEFVLFQASVRRHPVTRLEDLTGLTVGTSPGYSYGASFSESPYFRREAAPTHEANFGKLMLGRIDLLVTDRRVGRYLRKQLGLERQVEELPLMISRQAQYLGLARKPGREDLARHFSEELQRFKQEPAYAAINNRYSDDFGNIPGAVEQQERSTQR
ncbi:amino acid ABC transporter substrate-binding protein [Pseudomonas sp. SWI6]|uniref:Transporter substrate-binding domain-containing protein n=1 Tax=Pseudomonas taiwanensis TaxID=470150 RepID=A0ABR6V2P7_9PSED|nr:MULTISPECIES: transporter substrate-binding domain-containing protein [Pseudomonas]AGZ33266.1 extracellular solute-binding protein [Pseudomonas sp. VLB120]AVD85147.1 amino acid ABC transporter substrate-binding protein [Pseudomonas sp. SWI6]MBC3474696.1 transporter substrate-binding domain-containing protein [Pseudomonas taiwanensis]MBC3493695.1 transporter substrate-binding domain-containing protein [Pseudomonas taiwanensis]QQZ36754.1 transporter substrate-binding domain-containing protein